MEIFRVELPDLPNGYTPLEVVAVVKCLDNKGEPTIEIRASEGIMAWEAVGMLIAASDMTRADLQADLITPWEEEPEDTEDSREE